MKEYTIVELQEMMDSGKITSKKLVKMYLERIEEIDKQGPKLNSIIELNPDALVNATELDKERKAKGPRGKLHGIPVILKDNINTNDKMMTTAGSLALLNNRPTEDAFIVRNLRAAGAIILGKANLSEWANFRSTRSTSGWSSRGGLTLNPYVLNRSACGSSSGSAVSVAANLCSVAIGTETDGSVICPSQVNGIVGIKPTIGLVSRTGIIPIAHSQDIAGPMGRTVSDAAILLNTMIGIDSLDESTLGNEDKITIDYTKFLDKNGLKKARIGVARNYFGFNPDVDKLMEEAIEIMKGLGAEIVDPANLENLREIRDAEYTVLLYEFKDDLNKYLALYLTDNPNKTMKDIINYNEEHKDKIMPYFGQEHFIKAVEKGPLTDEEYKKALEKCRKITKVEGIDKVLQEHNLDAIIAPSGSPTWPIDLINGDHHTGGSSSAAAVSGYPSITLPLGYIHGLPVGISIFSTAFNEPVLIKFAYAFEQATKVRKSPKYLPNVKMD